jgi:hypothetical protein
MARRNKAHTPAIPLVVVPDAKTLQFSFKHLDLENPKFPVNVCTADFWMAFARELHRYSQLPVDEFTDANNDDHRHFIFFEETSVPHGFSHLDTEQVGWLEPWQFQIGVERWRVMGFVLDDTFFIVWLDPRHALYA